MNLSHLHTIYVEAVKIVAKEKAARQYVFRNDPAKLQSKVAEIDRLASILSEIKDALKPFCDDDSTPQAVQAPLLDIPPKTTYP